MTRTRTHFQGLLALSPLLIFLALYLASSALAQDFYKIPMIVPFLMASCYALVISRETDVLARVGSFSEGAGDKNILLMVWIFILAGVFASTARSIGAIDAAIEAILFVMPQKFILVGLFMSACFLSMAIGTSVGTIAALVPMAAGLASGIGASAAGVTAAVVGGAFFGDNLSFISDTTIAATRSQGCSMSDKFKVNLWIAAPAALTTSILYILLGSGFSGGTLPSSRPHFFLLLPYFIVILLALLKINVLAVLAIGVFLNAVIGFLCGSFDWIGFLESAGSGIQGMSELILVTMLAGGMLQIIRANGGIDYLIDLLTSKISHRRSAEFSIAALVSLANVCTANNTIAIITAGGIARDIGVRFGTDPRKTASILDTFSCIVQCTLPYGAQLLMASSLTGTPVLSIIGGLYYSLALLIFACLAICLDIPRLRAFPIPARADTDATTKEDN